MNESTHASGSIDQVADIFLAVGIELFAAVTDQEVGEGDEGAERFLEVMGDDVGEFVHLLVFPREFVDGRGQAVVLFAEFSLEPVSGGDVLRDDPGVEQLAA